MHTEIIINVGLNETRIGILDDGKLVELWIENPDSERMVGHIYKGIVNTVIPGIQAAFVDIGIEKRAFLHVSDVAEEASEFSALYDLENGNDSELYGKGTGQLKRRGIPIENILKKGQEILIQVTKEPISTKGARVTTRLSLPGRFTVLVPGQKNIGVSRKIQQWNERKRLRNIVRDLKLGNFGVIIRTVAQGKPDKTLASEIYDLKKTWEKILKTAESIKPPALIHKEMGMTSGVIRDLFSEDVDRVVIDSKEHYKEIQSYLKSLSSILRDKVYLYKEKQPIFDHYGIEKDIELAYERKIWLKSGGFLVFDHTEALTVVDVNSGRYVGKSDQEETILNINIEAAHEIARQLRLRDIGGIIVIDFIDMAVGKNRQRVMDEFASTLKNDRSKITISQISEFGLMEMTRQRVRPSLMFTFSEPCPVCDGVGMVQGRETTIAKIERWLKRARVKNAEKNFVLHVHPEVFDYLLDESEERLETIKRETAARISLNADNKLTIEEFKFFSEKTGKEITQQFTV